MCPAISRLMLCLLFLSTKSFAQMDAYSGTWQMDYLYGPGKLPVKLSLQIAVPERGLLYPAQLTVQSDTFNGVYELLLVKRRTRELAISRNKFARTEQPFNLDAVQNLLNGMFEYTKDLKGVPVLTLAKLQSKTGIAPSTQPLPQGGADKEHQSQLDVFFRNTDIVFRKVNDSAWATENRARVLSPALSPVYFGLKDTVHMPERDGVAIYPASRKKNEDVVSVSLNGGLVIDQMGYDKKDKVEEILLDTGLNILVFFADDMGNRLPSKGRLQLNFNGQKMTLDFADKADSAAMFIVAKLYCGQDPAKEKYFLNQAPMPGDKPLQKNEKLAGSIVSTSRQLNFAIWDDAQEDGDTISINLNGKWLVKDFPVKKRPQFIQVVLAPGTNTIHFIPNNLGSIPPNTSVLEIIDGNKRKSFFMEAILGESNVVKIFYDLKPWQPLN